MNEGLPSVRKVYDRRVGAFKKVRWDIYSFRVTPGKLLYTPALHLYYKKFDSSRNIEHLRYIVGGQT